MEKTEIDFKKISFEDALVMLEKIVRDLEAGQIKLDDAVKAYEQAVSLKAFCEKRLRDAELKIEKIEILSNGEVKITNFLEK